MPQVDIESFVSSCAGAVSCDRKVACETVVADQISQVEDYEPPESFWLSKDAEFDWFDRNAFFERRGSTRGNSTNLNPGLHSNPSHPGSNSNSQRFANIKSKASIIGLPMTQKVAYEEAKTRRTSKPVSSGKLFPKRTSDKAVETSLVEPSSPKVSCIGRVRSKRDKNRRMKNRQRSIRSTDQEKSTRKSGLLANVRAVFSRKRSGRAGVKNTDHDRTKSPSGDILDRLPADERDFPKRRSWDGVTTAPETMKRFTSGRRSAESLGIAGSHIDFRAPSI